MEKMKSPQRKRRKLHCCSSLPDKFDILFPILLAALSTPHNQLTFQSTLNKCFNKLHTQFSESLNSPEETLSDPMLSVLPVLLTHRCQRIACRSAEIAGAAALHSLRMNEQIALDDEIVRAIIAALGSSSKRVSVAACDALLDLSTTSVGRQRLLEFSSLERLIILFLQVSVSSSSISFFTGEGSSGCSKIAMSQERQKMSFLQAAISLINTCNIQQLENIPRKLSERFSKVLKSVWGQVHGQMLLSNPAICSPDAQFCIGNITVNNLAETIFRLCAITDQFAPLQSVSVERRIFGWREHSFENFMLHHWEASSFLLKRTSESCVQDDDIFSRFTESLNYKDLSFTFLYPMLQSFISCIPIESDELDILKFLEEGRKELGFPIIYLQDIRVIKTDKQSKREAHFFHENLGPGNTRTPHIFSLADITKCEEAYREGYTIALRGLEFRFTSIAAIADTLASLFGQPSVGANLYLTPPNSQGLACHCDDHCVFVCQVFGNKQWTVFSEPNRQLPRLYDNFDGQNCLNSPGTLAKKETFLLSEGDVLYVPRGFAHEACTENTGSGEFGRFSLHVTFGIEVEPPFEWAGFTHVSLCHWNQTRKQLDHTISESLSQILNVVTIYLLHAMIEQLSASDPKFRKACLVGALSLPLDRDDWLYIDQKTIFHHLVKEISSTSIFPEALSILKAAILKKEDLLHRIKWLELNTHFSVIENLLPVYVEHQDLAKATFEHIKTEFCNGVSFEDVIDSYRMLLEKYKTARKHYMNGMLSLHGN